MNQSGGHDQEVSCDGDAEILHLFQIAQILIGDLGDGNLVDVDFLLADEMEKQVQRAFKDLQLNRIVFCLRPGLHLHESVTHSLTSARQSHQKHNC